jgi:phosphoglycerate dehydrogenase-like enzyme
MSLTVWANHELRTPARELFYDSLSRLGLRLVQSGASTRDVLQPGAPDAQLAQADIAYGQPDPDELMRCPRVKWVAISTAGYTRYDRDDFRFAMRSRGTVVTNASSVFATPCAEQALAAMLAFARDLPAYVLNQAGPRAWNYTEGRYAMETLSGKTVVLLGYGAIGRRLAELLAPFRCRVIGIRRTPRGDEWHEMVGEAEAADVLPLADHVVNLLPDSPLTRRYCDARFFSLLRRGARYYNIGRGTTVDQVALVGALRSGQLQGAYLDVLDPEPLPPDHPLWVEPNCLITPHLAGGHREQDDNLVRHFLGNLSAYLNGGEMTDRIV